MLGKFVYMGTAQDDGGHDAGCEVAVIGILKKISSETGQLYSTCQRAAQQAYRSTTVHKVVSLRRVREVPQHATHAQASQRAAAYHAPKRSRVHPLPESVPNDQLAQQPQERVPPQDTLVSDTALPPLSG
uniref:Uncharacterized protein n=1 Tax=Timema cristinae TaxID=61476 RepID=A0A7R9CSS8_TIMCR|nr:unnamed protein product [Timema cristinae]